MNLRGNEFIEADENEPLKKGVGHWGVIHTRKNQYEANITVEPMDGSWKISGLELLEAKRIDPYGNANSK